MLQDYLIKYNTEVGMKSANLHDQLKTYADKFKSWSVEEGHMTPFSESMAAERSLMWQKYNCLADRF
jgi:hypothetical protein